MEYQTRMATEVEKWVVRLNAHMHGASRSKPVATAQYWLLGKIGSWATGPGLEAAYQRLLLTLSRARRASADVATSRKRLELRIGELEPQADETEGPGGEALDASQIGAAGQDQTIRDVTGQLADLRRQYADMQAREQRVHAANRRLFAEVNAFRTSKDAIKAAYTAAEEAAKAVSATATGDHLAQDDATGESAEPR
jgi:phage shock protein A